MDLPEEDGLVVKVGLTYYIDTDDDLVIEASQLIEDVDGEVIWNDSPYDGKEREDDEEATDTPADGIILGVCPEVKILEHDMEMIEAGIYILRAPEAIRKALAVIKVNPSSD